MKVWVVGKLPFFFSVIIVLYAEDQPLLFLFFFFLTMEGAEIWTNSNWIILYCILSWQLLLEETSRNDIVSKISLISSSRDAHNLYFCNYCYLTSSIVDFLLIHFFFTLLTQAFLYHRKCSSFDRIRYCVSC